MNPNPGLVPRIQTTRGYRPTGSPLVRGNRSLWFQELDQQDWGQRSEVRSQAPHPGVGGVFWEQPMREEMSRGEEE